MKLRFAHCLLLAFPLVVAPAVSSADGSDAWITTKAKLTLLTTDDVSASDVNVDTVEGTVTLHGKVESEAEKQKAETAIRGLDGVKEVKNLLQVVPESAEDRVEVADERIEEQVEKLLDADRTLEDVDVASVNDGVVLLSGESESVASELKAVEAAWKVDGVKRVKSEIETRDE